MRIQIDGPLAEGVTSKDLILHTIGVIGTAGGTGAVIEFCGTTIESLSMEVSSNFLFPYYLELS